MNKITAESYSLRDENGNWLGQIVLTSDGMYASVTDWGNLSFAWRNFGEGSFEDFLLSINQGYFATKMYCGIAYLCHTAKVEAACNRYAEHIFPALQKMLREKRGKG